MHRLAISGNVCLTFLGRIGPENGTWESTVLFQVAKWSKSNVCWLEWATVQAALQLLTWIQDSEWGQDRNRSLSSVYCMCDLAWFVFVSWGHEKRHSRLLNFFVFITINNFWWENWVPGWTSAGWNGVKKHFSTVEPLFDSISDQEMMNINILVMKKWNLDQRHEMN
jgi:hypothetical protein